MALLRPKESKLESKLTKLVVEVQYECLRLGKTERRSRVVGGHTTQDGSKHEQTAMTVSEGVRCFDVSMFDGPGCPGLQTDCSWSAY